MRLAWLLTHLPDPPWSRLLRQGVDGQHNDFALLSEPSWVAAALAYIKDVAAVKELRTKRKSEQPPEGKPTKAPRTKPPKVDSKAHAK